MKALITALSFAFAMSTAAHAQQQNVIQGKQALRFIERADTILETRRTTDGYETLLIHDDEVWLCSFTIVTQVLVYCSHSPIYDG